MKKETFGISTDVAMTSQLVLFKELKVNKIDVKSVSIVIYYLGGGEKK